MSFSIKNLTSKEKFHYNSLENLYDFCEGKINEHSKLISDIEETIRDWDKMMGGGSNLPHYTEKYLKTLDSNNREKARELYFLLSPIVFYINALYEHSRKSWRNAVTLCGIFCERICKNLILEIDKKIWLTTIH